MAVKVWRGTAVNIAQVDYGTVSGVWTEGDVAYLLINGSQLEVTIGAATTVADVTLAIAAAINGTSKTDSLVGTESRNFGGQEFPELTEVNASATATQVVIEGNTAGIPFTITWPAPSTASTGTISGSTPVAATGRWHWDNADNWSGAAIPVVGDQIVFQDSNVDCLYGLSQYDVTNVTIQCDSSFTGKLGLPALNVNGYSEYRQRHLGIKFSSAARSLVLGGGPGNGTSRFNVDASDSAVQAVVEFTGSPESGTKAVFDLIGNAIANVAVRQGSVSLGALATNDSSVTTLEMTYNTQLATDALVYVGTKGRVGTIVKAGGELTFINTDGGTVASCTNRAGTAEFHGAIGVTDLSAEGGTIIWKSTGTLATPVLTGAATLDFSKDANAKTVTNPIERYSDASRVIDPNQTVSNLRIDNNNCSDTTNLILGTNFRLTRGAVA